MIIYVAIILFICCKSFAIDGPIPTNQVTFTVGQDYIISSDVIAKGGAVADQFDGIVPPEDLPGDFGDSLQEYIDNSWDTFQEWSFNQYSNALPSVFDDIHDLNMGLKNSRYYGDYFVTNDSLEVGASNIMPSGNIVSNFISVFRRHPGSSTNQNVFSIYRFGDWNREESFFLKLTLIPNHLYIDLDSNRDFSYHFKTVMWYINNGMRLLITLLTFWVLVKTCYAVVSIFTGGNE